jgi:hypothetical protein
LEAARLSLTAYGNEIGSRAKNGGVKRCLIKRETPRYFLFIFPPNSETGNRIEK